MKHFTDTLKEAGLAAVAVVAVAVLALVLAPVSAQGAGLGSGLGSPATVYSSANTNQSTNYIGAAATVTNANIDCSQGKELALQVTYTHLTAVAATNTVIALQSSLDASTWSTWANWTVQGNGTTAVCWTTNMTVYAVPWIRVRTITPGSASASEGITNVVIKAWVK